MFRPWSDANSPPPPGSIRNNTKKNTRNNNNSKYRPRPPSPKTRTNKDNTRRQSSGLNIAEKQYQMPLLKGFPDNKSLKAKITTNGDIERFDDDDANYKVKVQIEL